jgi:glycosyltransferase involved in cell wall biosynthesis
VSDRGALHADSLRILVVNWLDRENPQAGGAEIHLHETFGRLARRGHDVTALVSGWRGCAPAVTLDHIHVRRAGTRYTFSLAAPAHYRRHLATRGFDVVVEDLNKVPLFTPLWVEAPVVLLAHHLFGRSAFEAERAPLAALTMLLERPVPRAFVGVPTIAVSESTKDDLVQRGLSSDQIEVIRNGIDVDHYTPGDVPRYERPTLLYLGRLKRYKHIDLGLEAAARLVAEGIDLELVIVGDGEESAALQAKARALGIEGRAHFLGFIDEERKLEVLRRSWVHVLTSPKEGWGISNLEAAACGTPSVASDSPGLRESVVDGATGLLVPHGDVPALTEALRRLLRDPDLHTRMSRQARAFARRFSWDATTDAVEAALIRVVAGSPPH